jgi:HK97 family phage portal protein
VSLIGKALAIRNAAPPVPMAPRRNQFSQLSMGVSDVEAYMRAYGTQGTVHANVSMLAASTAKPEWRLYRKERQDGRVRYTTSDQGSDQRTEVTRHAALDVLNKPATVMIGGREHIAWTRFSLFEISGIWLETTGRAPWIVEYDPRANFPIGLWPVSPARIEPVPDPDTYLKGYVYTAPDGREKIPLLPHEVIMNRYANPIDPYGGLGPIQTVLTEIDANRYAGAWNRNFFLNSAEPGGIIQVDHSMDDDEFDQMITRWREAHQGVARAHRVAVLEGGATWVPNGHGQKDMDFVSLVIDSRDAIREALGMHKVMTGVTDDVNRANAQTGEEVFANWKIVPRLDRWKDVLNFQFLPLFGSTGEGVEFDYIYPLPANREQDNAELMAKAQAALWLAQAGYDQSDLLEVIGLPDMGVTAPPAGSPPKQEQDMKGPPGDDGEPDQNTRRDSHGEFVSAAADMPERLRKMLANGHLPVEAAR